jgi:Flp pilus assembly protein TadD
MSILADLLSKNKWGESQGGKEIPPTLARAQEAVAKKQTPKKRYIFIAVAAVVITVAGLAMTSLLGRINSHKPVKYPMPPAAAPVAPPQAPVTPSPQQPAQPQPASSIAQNKAAELQPKPNAAFTTKRAPRPHKLHKHAAVKPVAVKKRTTTGSAQKAAPKRNDAAFEPRMGAVSPSPSKVDTAARGALLYAARSAEQAGDWRLALANYRKAQEIDPDNYKIMSNAAAALNNLGMFEDGLKEARRALDRKPGYLPAMINAAIAHSSTGNSKEALRLFSAACTADPSNRNLAINLGILQERMGKLDEARATYRRLAESGDPLALMGMGRVLERKGNKSEAAYNYRQILALRNITPSIQQEARARLTRLEY